MTTKFSPPTIPPNATLQFDVELLSWTSVKDICKDGGIFKKILTEGEKWENPKDPDEVSVKYEVRLEDGKLVAKSDGVEFTVNEGYCKEACENCPSRSSKEKRNEIFRLKKNLMLVVVQLDQVSRVSPSTNRMNPKEKYIQVVTVDGYEFVFMGFMSYDKALKTLNEAMQQYGNHSRPNASVQPQ
ncbi:GRAM domain [Sesbania bispinosa]|nr:GRAM domain [Sesbania bispinosa]